MRTGRGYRVELSTLLSAAQGLHRLSDEVHDGSGALLTPPEGGNRGFASAQAVLTVTEAWQAELGECATALRAAGAKLAQTAAEYERVDLCCVHGFQRILDEERILDEG